SFEAAGLTLNPNGSENDKITSCLQAIFANHNESNPDDKLDNKHDDELYSENVSDDDPEDMMNFD
ncbi:36849_t:CDS:2, partial [Gigaspora margarita]